MFRSVLNAVSVSLFLLLANMGFAQDSRNTITVCASADASALNPFTNISLTGGFVNEYLYTALLGFSQHTGQYVPLLASEMPLVLDNGRTIIYTIHPQAMWNSGQPVTVEDVVFSAKLIRSPYLRNTEKRGFFANINDVQVFGVNQVAFYLERPHPALHALTGALPVFQANWFDPQNTIQALTIDQVAHADKLPYAERTALRIISEKVSNWGTIESAYDARACAAPYILKEWKMNEKILLEANPKFWGRNLEVKPNELFAQDASSIQILITPDEKQVRELLFAGQVDAALNISAKLFYDLSPVREIQDEYRFESAAGQMYEYVGMNMRNGANGRASVFSDVLTRKALSAVCNVDYMLENVVWGQGKRISAEFPIHRPGYAHPDLQLLAFDPGKAMALLAAAGWEDADGNGILDRETAAGKQEFRVEFMYNLNRPERGILGEKLKVDAKAVGIEIEIVGVEWREYLERLSAGNFDLFAGAWSSDPVEESYRQVWHTEAITNGANFTGFGDAATDQLIERFDQEIDPARRQAICRQIQSVLYEEQPYIFLWASTRSMLIRRNLRSAEISPYGAGFYLPEWEKATRQ